MGREPTHSTQSAGGRIGFFIEDDGQRLPDEVKIQLEALSGMQTERGDGFRLRIVDIMAEEHG